MKGMRFLLALRYAKYDHTPAKVEEGVYLGSIGAAKTKKTLLALGITHILTAASDIAPMHPENFIYLTLPILDLKSQDLMSVFDEAIGFIDQAISMGGKVLIHCFAGKSRSASIAASWLIARRGYSTDSALQLLQEVRPQVQPNEGFLQQLIEYEIKVRLTGQEIQMERDVPLFDATAGLLANFQRTGRAEVSSAYSKGKIDALLELLNIMKANGDRKHVPISQILEACGKSSSELCQSLKRVQVSDSCKRKRNDF